MSKKLLIDARLADETRVVLLSDGSIEDVNYETSHRKPLKGNIYLAKVTRVEPSLQAAFVEYGGNRQGFLPFSEIHPDYYRIPVEDREKLLEEEKQLADSDTELDDDPERTEGERTEGEEDDAGGGFDPDDDLLRRRRFERFRRHYTIQEVISKRQILLVQAVKEERGGKGAALTTYLSLAGRYCVLMPNTYHRGGVSRKISDPADRKKLKKIVSSLDIPPGMAVIVRTAGAKRTKAEITRDYTYLQRQWNDIRTLTLESSAPMLIHEEANLIKRTVRDHYTSDIEEILVEGSKGYKAACAHMKNLMPTHVKRIKEHKNPARHLFQEHNVEAMLAAMHEPRVSLRSGGYLVINQTEALVAIDVNSGRSTRERNIEETALKTNLEAATEIARQLKQRDLSGLIVIDFIDMDVSRNRGTVERKLKEALKPDRARVQVGGISQFGLLEMSRQRLRPSLSESVSDLCPHCAGTGRIRSMESVALSVIRQIESEVARKSRPTLTISMSPEVALYILNHKRAAITELEAQHETSLILASDSSLLAPQVRFEDVGKSSPGKKKSADGPVAESDDGAVAGDDGGDEGKSRRRRRRGKRGGVRQNHQPNGEAGAGATGSGGEPSAPVPLTSSPDDKTKADAPKADETPGTETDATTGTGAEAKPVKRQRHKKKKDEPEQGISEAPMAEATGEKKQARRGKKTEDKAGKDAATDADAEKPAQKQAAKPKRKKAETTPKPTSSTTESPKSGGRTRKSAKAASESPAPQKTAAADIELPAATPVERKKESSAAINVVNVDQVSGSGKKQGWWSR